MNVIRAIGALVAGFLGWKAVATLATMLGDLIWPAYAAVEQQRTFTLDMYLTRLGVGALATIVFGIAATLVAGGDRRIVRGVLAVWLTYSIVDHYLVWNQFPVWYHLVYLGYIVPFVLLGEALVRRKKMVLAAQ
jgi:hypothetical protein